MKIKPKGSSGPKETVLEPAPIVLFSARGNLERVKKFIKEGADVNAAYTKRSRTHPEVRRGSTALMEAILHGKEDMAYFLIKHGADINREDEVGHNALYYAARQERTKLVKELLRRGSKLSDDVLCGPVFHANIELVKLLIAKGANLNCVFDRKNEEDGVGGWPIGETILGYALREVDYPPKIAELLIKAGADVDQPSKWMCLRDRKIPIVAPIIPLRIAVNHAPQFVEILWKAGAKGTLQDALADATLERAIYNENIEVIKLCIKAGMDVNERGVTGKLPVEIALQKGNNKILALLKQAGAVHQQSQFP